MFATFGSVYPDVSRCISRSRKEISEIQSKFIPPLSREKIPNMTRMSNEDLVDFILLNPHPEVIDCYDKREIYHQPIHSTHVTKLNINISNELQLIFVPSES